MRNRPIANPPNPWRTTELRYLDEIPEARIEVFEDSTREILSRNESPDVPFRWSVNPYRGCYHACAYCYARTMHEYLDLGAGSDFERKIMVKKRAPVLLRAAFARPSWQRETVAFSGATDCYQPLEASYRLTRSCLEACVDFRNPVGIITRSPLIERDLDVLERLREVASVFVAISIPLGDPDHVRALEPGAPPPARRLRTIERLARAGFAPCVMVAPVIPGLGDEGLARVLTDAASAGATRAAYILLRLPGTVKAVFEERLRHTMPARANRVLARMRDTRAGALDDPRWGTRQRGDGPHAEAIRMLFESTARRLGLEFGPVAELDRTVEARRPTEGSPRQLELALVPARATPVANPGSLATPPPRNDS